MKFLNLKAVCECVEHSLNLCKVVNKELMMGMFQRDGEDSRASQAPGSSGEDQRATAHHRGLGEQGAQSML